MIEINDLYAVRGIGREVFHIHIPHLKIQTGELLAVTGDNGTGKSTFLEILGLLLAPQQSSGSMIWQIDSQHYDIAAIWRSHPEQLNSIRKQHIGFVLQSGGLLPFLTVYDNIILPMQLLNQATDHSELDHIIQYLKITKLLQKKPAQLSVGQRQLVAIARSLVHQPSLLLADEPTSALDSKNADMVMNLFVDLIRSQNKTAVIVTHDRSWVERLKLREIRAILNTSEKSATIL